MLYDYKGTDFTQEELAQEIRDDLDFHMRYLGTYNEILDEKYPHVSIGGMTFSPSEILYTLDPSKYEDDLTKYTDDLMDEIMGNVDKLGNNELYFIPHGVGYVEAFTPEYMEV